MSSRGVKLMPNSRLATAYCARRTLSRERWALTASSSSRLTFRSKLMGLDRKSLQRKTRLIWLARPRLLLLAVELEV